MEICIACAIAAVVGAIITIIFVMPKSTAGILYVDRTNPKKDLYRFDIIDLDALGKSRYVLLKVNEEKAETDDSQD